jgi:two-component system, NarL family, nitrate/nitrite response regulator NarL
MPPPLRLLVVADDAVSRAGLRALAESAGFAVIGETPAEDLSGQAEDEADALVWDVGSSGALEALRAIATRVPIVAVLWDAEQAKDALAAGARAVLRRDGLEERLAPAVQAALAGLVSIEMSLAEALAATRGRPGAEIVEALTPRESEVLQLLAEGFTNRRIGERLAISEHTVKFHVNSILGKLGAQTRGEAIAQAARLGLLLL